MTSQNIWIVDDSNGHNNTCYEELGNEGFTISILNPTEKELKGKGKPKLIILNLKCTGEDDINLIKKFQIKNIPMIICLEWGKDILSFSIWASDVNGVKSGVHKDLKFTIKEVLA